MCKRLIILLLLLLSSCSSQENKDFYVIARDKAWYPLNLMGKASNLTALTDDILYAIAKEGGIHLEIISVTTNGLVSGLDTGFYDGAVTFMNPTAVNLDHYEFSKPFFFIGPVLVVEADSDATEINDLKGKIIGIHEEAKEIIDLKEYSSISFRTFENILFALEDLSLGHIDAVIIPSVPAHVFTNSSLYRGILKVATAPLTKEGLRLITFRNDQPNDLVDIFNRGFTKIRENGTLNSLLEKWDLH